MWHARLAQHYRHSAGAVAFGRFVQGCSSRSEAHVAGQDLTTLLGLKYMHVCIRCAPPCKVGFAPAPLWRAFSRLGAAAGWFGRREFFLRTDWRKRQNTAGRCPLALPFPFSVVFVSPAVMPARALRFLPAALLAFLPLLVCCRLCLCLCLCVRLCLCLCLRLCLCL